MRWLSSGKRVLLAAIGVAIGVNGVRVAVAPGQIPATYGIVVDDPDLAVLLRHRAVMLALIGGTLTASALRRELRKATIPAAALAMSAFSLFALTTPVNEAQRQVAHIDLALLTMLGATCAIPECPQPHLTAARS